MEIAAAVEAVARVVALVKKAQAVADRLKDVEARSCLVELMSALTDAREEMETLRAENVRLREEVRRPRDVQDVRHRLVARGTGYFLRDPMEGYAEGPYCTTCMDTRGDLVLMVKEEPPFDVFGYTCGHCRRR
jgi:hypothetical protein